MEPIFLNAVQAVTLIVDAIQDIPAVFWGVLVGSALSLSGVVISNRSNAKRLDTQLANDREVKRIDREFAAKKEIFMEAAEAVSIALRSLGNFANMELAHTELTKDYTARASVLAKVYVVGSPKTMRAMADVGLKLSGAFLELTEKRMPLQRAVAVLAVENKTASNAQADFDRLMEMQKEYNFAGKQDLEEWQRLRRLGDHAMARAAETRQHSAQHAAEIQIQALELAREAFRLNGEASNLLTPLLQEIRAELGLDFDVKVFERIAADNAAQLKEAGERFLRMVKGGPVV